jgi:hypothetical protein
MSAPSTLSCVFITFLIVKYCVVVLNYLFGVSKNSQFRENDLAKKPGPEKSRVFALRIMSFHKNSERCDLIWSLNGPKAFPFQLNVRYLANGVVTEKLRFPYDILIY